MWAYVDETGNTGNRIFDPDQPLFITAAMMTGSGIDAAAGIAPAGASSFSEFRNVAEGAKNRGRHRPPQDDPRAG